MTNTYTNALEIIDTASDLERVQGAFDALQEAQKQAQTLCDDAMARISAFRQEQEAAEEARRMKSLRDTAAELAASLTASMESAQALMERLNAPRVEEGRAGAEESITAAARRTIDVLRASIESGLETLDRCEQIHGSEHLQPVIEEVQGNDKDASSYLEQLDEQVHSVERACDAYLEQRARALEAAVSDGKETIREFPTRLSHVTSLPSLGKP